MSAPHVPTVSRFTRSLGDFSALAASAAADDDDMVKAITAAAGVLEAEFDTVVGALQERQALLERLAKIQRSITRRADLQETLDAIVAGAAELLDEPCAGLRLSDEHDATMLRLVSAVGSAEHGIHIGQCTPVHDGVGGRSVAEERLVVEEDYAGYARPIGPLRDAGARAAIAAPVRERGRVIGSLAIASFTPGRRFTAYERDALLAFADHASLALTDARMVADALHQAAHDPLTGLPNRMLFSDRVERALARARRRGSRVAVLFFDLDHFKVVNDSLGHHVGDKLLGAVAERLRDHLRESDTVARFGGDEFAVLLEDVDGPEGPVRVAEHLIDLLARPILLGGRAHVVSASIGIAMSGPGSSSPAALVRDADAAMYRAKLAGRGTFSVFDDGMRRRAMERLRLDSELRAALERDEFELVFQPIVALEDGAVLGAEALLRWRHPTRGVLAPGEFIAVAVDSGLIGPIGEWVVQEACRTCATWPGDVPVSVNLSPRQVAPRLVGVVRDAVEAAGLSPSRLALEITEDVLLEDADGARETLKALRALGVQLLLDDFGTGYSSLGYLHRLPLDGLKVDRSFVSGAREGGHEHAIVAAIVALASSLGLTVVAEGVETAGEGDMLRSLGCEVAQGFHFSRPLSPEAFEARLALRSARSWPTRRPPAAPPRPAPGPAAVPDASAA